MPAVLFGSISTIADTSELQRSAFNEAFAAHSLDWEWSQDDYRSMLGGNGGAQRIADYAASRGVDVDADAVHATKSEIFQRRLGEGGVQPREGVLETVAAARDQGLSLGFVTTTSAANIDALLAALSPQLTRETFDVIVDVTDVSTGKPDPASYAYALAQLGTSPAEAVAIEDNEGGVQAAAAAGVACVAFPNENTVAVGDFSAATDQVDRLDPQRVMALAAS